MKKVLVILIMALMLAGCGKSTSQPQQQEETYRIGTILSKQHRLAGERVMSREATKDGIVVEFAPVLEAWTIVVWDGSMRYIDVSLEEFDQWSRDEEVIVVNGNRLMKAKIIEHRSANITAKWRWLK